MWVYMGSRRAGIFTNYSEHMQEIKPASISISSILPTTDQPIIPESYKKLDPP